MAILNYETGEATHRGKVTRISTKYWLDGMFQEFAHVWDSEKHEEHIITIGYYGIDGINTYPYVAEVDISTETARDIIKTTKRVATKAFADSVVEYKNTVHKGDHAEVIRGKKIPKGTQLDVFWVGNRPTWKAKNSPSWSYYKDETELMAGCYDQQGNKIWIKAEYLKRLNKIDNPTRKERDKYIKSYIEKNLNQMIIQKAKF